jgi:hypothetical protein
MDTKTLVDLAASFWDRVAELPPFPRNLEATIAQVTPVWVVPRPDLRPGVAQAWLRQRRLRLPLHLPDRPLDGCILAFRGVAVIFVDETLPTAERRVIVAHEFAHYLAEYEWPRDRARRRLGPTLAPLLDGIRPATPAENWAAALAGVRLEAHVHYMERTFDPCCLAAVDHVERTANALACELLAPQSAVRAEACQSGLGLGDCSPWQRLLEERFGLPARWAIAYAGQLLTEARRHRSFCDRLGL